MSDTESAEIRALSEALRDVADEVHAQGARLTIVEERAKDRADTLARVEATQREHAGKSEASFARIAEQLARIEAAAAQSRQPWTARDWAILLGALVPLAGVAMGLGYQIEATAQQVSPPLPVHDRVQP